MHIGAIDESATLGGSWIHRASPLAKLSAFVFVQGREPEAFASLSRTEMADIFSQLLGHLGLELIRDNSLRQGSHCRIASRK